jgi:hypothetical protein
MRWGVVKKRERDGKEIRSRWVVLQGGGRVWEG